MTFQDDIKQLHELNQSPKEPSLVFPEYRGLSFRAFWEKLPNKLVFTEYEEILAKTLETKKKVRVKKAGGLGITEFFTRWISWNCLKDDDWKNRQVDVTAVILTGANQDLTNRVIGRIKALFTGQKEFKTKESVVILNGCRIEAFPTNHLEPSRGLNPRIVLLDEADFFPLRYQDEARTVAERYRTKGDALIAMVSTPNMPGGLYERMDEEGESKGYTLLEFNYEWGLGIVFDPETIEKEKRENPSFEREFNLQYGYGLGDIFEGLDDCIKEYDLQRVGGRACLTGDPAFGSSNFGICAGETRDSSIYVLEASEFPRPSPSAMLDVMENMAHTYDDNVKIDAAHPGFIRDLEERGIPAIPVNFGLQIREHESANKQSLRSKMTINAAQLIKNKRVMIHPSHKKLISQLRAARFDKMGGVDKEELNFDIGDAFLMLCWDLKEFDYSSRAVSVDGKIYAEEKDKSYSFTMKTETIE